MADAQVNRTSSIPDESGWQSANESLAAAGKGGGDERPHYRALRQFTLKKYGLTPDDYAALWTAQGGLCAICRREETAMREGVRRVLCVDHDKHTGRVRGLLCAACNMALGLFIDNRDSLRAAIAYLDAADPVFERVPSVQLPIRGVLHLGESEINSAVLQAKNLSGGALR